MRFDVRQDITEQGDIAIDQIKTTLIRLSPKPGCDHDNVRIRTGFRSGRVDVLRRQDG